MKKGWKLDMKSAIAPAGTIEQKSSVEKLIREMVAENIDEIKPILFPNSELGFTYSRLEKLLGMNTRDMTNLCELLVEENILIKCYSLIIFRKGCNLFMLQVLIFS